MCQCGCGQPTKLYEFNNASKGAVRGQPQKLIRGHQRFTDLKGKQLGKLLVLRRAENKYGQIRWWCRCACGVEKSINGANLRNGIQTACGCNCHLRPYEALFNSCRTKAGLSRRKSKGHSWKITYAEFLTFICIKQCHYCKATIRWPRPFGDKNEAGQYAFSSNLDRKDNTQGYSKENCVVCCWSCNEAKGSKLSYEEMLAVGNLRRKKECPK